MRFVMAAEPVLQFPPSFSFGAASAAYQVEGSPLADGKGPSIWDAFVRKRGKIVDGSSGDMACDHYRRFQEDVGIMADLGLDSYRFSISWPRIQPSGKRSPNVKGLDFYDQLVDALLENRIKPMVTLFHWDLPLALQEEYDGFSSREVTELFSDYAYIVASNLGDRVKQWITINEPLVFASFGHLFGTHAPGKRGFGTFYRVLHHLLLAHGLAVQRIHGTSPMSRIGIALNLSPVYPRTQRHGDAMAASLADDFRNRLTLDPIFSGRYPESVWRKARQLRKAVFQDDMSIISTPTEYFGLNHYTRTIASRNWLNPFMPFSIDAVQTNSRMRAGKGYTTMGQEIFPRGMYEVLMRMKDEYNNPPVYITENGNAFPDTVTSSGTIQDDDRIAYLRGYLYNVSKAISDGCDVRGYCHWSLTDNFEWAEGYTQRFGLARVDFQTQQRTMKESGYWYKNLIASKGRPFIQ